MKTALSWNMNLKVTFFEMLLFLWCYSIIIDTKLPATMIAIITATPMWCTHPIFPYGDEDITARECKSSDWSYMMWTCNVLLFLLLHCCCRHIQRNMVFLLKLWTGSCPCCDPSYWNFLFFILTVLKQDVKYGCCFACFQANTYEREHFYCSKPRLYLRYVSKNVQSFCQSLFLKTNLSVWFWLEYFEREFQLGICLIWWIY